MARRKFTREFNVSAVKLVNEQGYGIAEAAKSLGVDNGSVRDWVKKFSSEAGMAPTGEGVLAAESRQLRKDPSPAPSDTRPSSPIEISPKNLKPGAESYFHGMIHDVVEDEAAVLRCVSDRFGIPVPPAPSDAQLQPILHTPKAQLASVPSWA